MPTPKSIWVTRLDVTQKTEVLLASSAGDATTKRSPDSAANVIWTGARPPRSMLRSPLFVVSTTVPALASSQAVAV